MLSYRKQLLLDRCPMITDYIRKYHLYHILIESNYIIKYIEQTDRNNIFKKIIIIIRTILIFQNIK